jgi:hypothetical protein
MRPLVTLIFLVAFLPTANAQTPPPSATPIQARVTWQMQSTNKPTLMPGAQCGVTAQATCWNTGYHMVRVAPDRLLLASAEDELTTLMELSMARSGETTRVALRSQSRPLEKLPYTEREAIVQTTGGFDERQAQGAAQSRSSNGMTGHRYPIIQGVHYTLEKLSVGTRHMPDFVREPDSPLFDFGPRSPGEFRQPPGLVALGDHTILKGSAEASDATVWSYDVARQRFAHKPVQLNYAGTKAVAPPSLQLFSSSNGKAYAYDRRTHQLSRIDEQLTLHPEVQLPAPTFSTIRMTSVDSSMSPCNAPLVAPEPKVETMPCGATRHSPSADDVLPSHWYVDHVNHDSQGRMWLRLSGRLHVVDGQRVMEVVWLDSAGKPGEPLPIKQMVPGLAGDMVVLTAEGIAAVQVRTR